jgi:hypothetical protein
MPVLMMWDSSMSYILFVHVYMPYFELVKIIYYLLFTSALYFVYFVILYNVIWEAFNYAEVHYYKFTTNTRTHAFICGTLLS